MPKLLPQADQPRQPEPLEEILQAGKPSHPEFHIFIPGGHCGWVRHQKIHKIFEADWSNYWFAFLLPE